jgi:hypothetical protein
VISVGNCEVAIHSEVWCVSFPSWRSRFCASSGPDRLIGFLLPFPTFPLRGAWSDPLALRRTGPTRARGRHTFPHRLARTPQIGDPLLNNNAVNGEHETTFLSSKSKKPASFAPPTSTHPQSPPIPGFVSRILIFLPHLPLH